MLLKTQLFCMKKTETFDKLMTTLDKSSQPFLDVLQNRCS